MKTLCNTKTTISADGKTATITGDIVEKKFDLWAVTRTTHGYLNPKNMAHHRHIQSSHEALFVYSGQHYFGISHDDLVSIAAAIEPKTSFAPKLDKVEQDLTVHLESELNPYLQWEVGDKVTTEFKKNHFREEILNWRKIEGQTKPTLDKSTVKPGQFVRCVASSEAGSMTSNAVEVK